MCLRTQISPLPEKWHRSKKIWVAPRNWHHSRNLYVNAPKYFPVSTNYYLKIRENSSTVYKWTCCDEQETCLLPFRNGRLSGLHRSLRYIKHLYFKFHNGGSIQKQRYMYPGYLRTSDGPIPLLAGCVPDLSFNRLSVNLNTPENSHSVNNVKSNTETNWSPAFVITTGLVSADFICTWLPQYSTYITRTSIS